jgi:maleylpyruvate isomerase
MTTLRLHNYWRSSASYRVRIALALKGVAYEYVAVNIFPGDGGSQQHDDGYRARNPMAQVPTLEIVEDDGRTLDLTQSLPIIEYLDERFSGPPLLPRGAEAIAARARVRALAEMVNAGIQPLQNLSTLREVKAMGGDDRAWLSTFITRGMAALETAVGAELPPGLAAGRYCVGDAITLADFCLVPQL